MGLPRSTELSMLRSGLARSRERNIFREEVLVTMDGGPHGDAAYTGRSLIVKTDLGDMYSCIRAMNSSLR